MSEHKHEDTLRKHEDWLKSDRSNVDRHNLTCHYFANTSLHYANFSYADLTGSKFWDSDLTNANFTSAILRDTDFSNAKLFYADLTNADLTSAWFLHAQFFLIGSLRGIVYDNADFGHIVVDEASINKFPDPIRQKFLHTWDIRDADYNPINRIREIDYMRGYYDHVTNGIAETSPEADIAEEHIQEGLERIEELKDYFLSDYKIEIKQRPDKSGHCHIKGVTDPVHFPPKECKIFHVLFDKLKIDCEAFIKEKGKSMSLDTIGWIEESDVVDKYNIMAVNSFRNGISDIRDFLYFNIIENGRTPGRAGEYRLKSFYENIKFIEHN